MITYLQLSDKVRILLEFYKFNYWHLTMPVKITKNFSKLILKSKEIKLKHIFS